MTLNKCFLFQALHAVLVLTQARTAAAQLEWKQKASLPGDVRHHPITFANETHGFLMTGSLEEGDTADFFLYDEAADQWTQVSDFPGGSRSFGYGVVLNEPGNNKAYVGFGNSEIVGLLGDLWELDMQTLTWKQLTDFPGLARRHPAMNAVLVDGQWEIQVGLGDDLTQNLNDWWSYNVASDTWRQEEDFPGSRRHHPFHFVLGDVSYAGLGHSDGLNPYIEKDFYSFGPGKSWAKESDFVSMDKGSVVTTEARVAGTQFSIDHDGKSLGFVLSGDGDDHDYMETGEFHMFDGATWHPLPPHPGHSRWAPGSFVIKDSARVYFTSGLDRFTFELHNDLWMIDLESVFSATESTGVEPNTPDGTDTSSQQAAGWVFSALFVGAVTLLVNY